MAPDESPARAACQQPADIRVTVRLPAGTVTLLPKRAPIGHGEAIRGRTVTVLPTPPEAAGSGTRSESPAGHERFPATIGAAEEPAVAIIDLDESAARARGQAAGLREVFFWDGRRARLLACE